MMKPYEMDALNYKVKTIEMFLGVQLADDSVDGKKAFVERYWAERTRVSDDMLQEAFEEAKE